jgi:hypothetical protein
VKVKIVYIAGYGRSGSTVLDILISKKDDSILGSGEMTYVAEDMLSNQDCTCGHKYAQCSTWSPIANLNLTLEDCNFLRTMESRGGVVDLFHVPRFSKKDSDRYKGISLKIFEELGQYQVIVDSSKTAHDAFWRPFLLSSVADLDVYVIHLKRDIFSVLKSVWKKSNWSEEGKSKDRNSFHRLARTFVGWIMANYQAQRMKRLLGGGNYLYVDYSDFIDNPEKIFNSIGKLIGQDFSKHAIAIKKGKEFLMSDSHNVGGNRLRLSKAISLKR